ncbi:hypothetical protein [Szabonella alba]|uniref:Uncharacterized protein n=1 Tax=Szabonella alba TaxID=2804194 RepID=A0A8K0VDE5_9RHOB|nr:hypothetical protein [Szabonella alba]MBL4917654.1 hypothetical protein [Szabonella alba]
MARQREVGTLWIGGSLSWLEQLCLKSFVDQGQKITLFSYEDIPNVPDGVIRRDGREIYDTDDFIKYEKKDSFALFADLFRIHMLRACPGMIWVDTDVYCHRPMTYDDDHVMGFELPDSRRVNNAVLGLPADSAILSDMIAFMEDRHAIPPFLKKSLREEYRNAAAEGHPVHVSQQPWGVWGPMMITHFVAEHRLLDRVQPLPAFYPIPFPDRLTFLKRSALVERLLTSDTTALHLWASNKRELGLRHAGLPPKGSYLADLLARHDIRPEAAPITGRGKRVFDAGLVNAVNLAEVPVMADIGGNAQSVALAAWGRWSSQIDLVDIDHKGNWPGQASDWVAPYREFLLSNGVPDDAIRVVSVAKDLRQASLVANLSGFGDVNRLAPLEALFGPLIGPGARLLTDIRKGSGAYPLFRSKGERQLLSTRSDNGLEIARVIVAVHGQPGQGREQGKDKTAAPAAEPAPASGDNSQTWGAIAATLATGGGWTRESADHSFLYIPRGDTLVVTFDNLDIAMTKREDRRPWGFSFIEKQGWSMLGVMANGWTWYRDAWVSDQFDDLAASGFFKGFRRVVFYGASMGGYAACAFSGACPGASVLAISPQSTLDRSLVPFETRYRTAWGRDFSGPYGDAAQVSGAAERVTILFDPYEPLDAGHVARFTGANVLKLRAPLLGHRLGSSLQQMGILAPITLGALNGTLTEAEFYRILRARKGFTRYQKELFQRALDKGHVTLARRMGRFVLTRGDNRHIRKKLAAL